MPAGPSTQVCCPPLLSILRGFGRIDKPALHFALRILALTFRVTPQLRYLGSHLFLPEEREKEGKHPHFSSVPWDYFQVGPFDPGLPDRTRCHPSLSYRRGHPPDPPPIVHQRSLLGPFSASFDRTDMSWTAWTSLVPTLLIVSAIVAWWFTEPKNARVNLIAAAGVLLFCWAVAPDFSQNFSASVLPSLVNGVAASRLDLFIVKHAKMLLTGAAAVWYVLLWPPPSSCGTAQHNTRIDANHGLFVAG